MRLVGQNVDLLHFFKINFEAHSALLMQKLFFCLMEIVKIFPLLSNKHIVFVVFLYILLVPSVLVQCHDRIFRQLSTDTQSSLQTPEIKTGFRRIVLSIVLGALTGVVGALLFASFVRAIVIYLHKTPILKGPVIFSPKISPKTLELTLTSENHLLGSSPNGKYYRTVLDNGLVIAVKRLEPFETGSSNARTKSVKRKIQKELEVLASLRHVNIMSLRAYLCEQGSFSLVYDYVPTGSLEDVMNRVRENELQLSWEVRLKIAVGIIKGLQFLHFGCNPQVLHYDLKPRNVMLDGEYQPRLADWGLAEIMPHLDRATGYSAPECFQNSRYNDKSDIFSFGMILAVLLTGRDPSDPFFGEAAGGGSLGRWLRHLQHAGEAREALDKSILGEEVEEDEMLMAVRIAVVCLSDFPADRPSSEDLVPVLTQLHSF